MKRALRIAGLAFAGAIVLVLLFHTTVLTALGAYLEQDSLPAKADVAFVLAGDGYGRRILKGVAWFARAYAPRP